LLFANFASNKFKFVNCLKKYDKMIVGELESEKDGEWLYLRRDEEDYAYVGIRIDKPRIYKPDLRILKDEKKRIFC